VNYGLWAFISIAVLLLALGWFSLSKLRRRPPATLAATADREWRHIAYLTHIKQALAGSDLEFLEAYGSTELSARVRKERQVIALRYLRALRKDFEKLLHFARVIAAMSPEVEVVQELQGLRVHAEFSYRYYLIYVRLRSGMGASRPLGDLSDMVSALTMQVETAISELGERAALGAEISLYGSRGIDAG
jgi:hypothetical protein